MASEFGHTIVCRLGGPAAVWIIEIINTGIIHIFIKDTWHHLSSYPMTDTDANWYIYSCTFTMNDNNPYIALKGEP